MDNEAARSFTRRASGNELKILLAIRHLEDHNLPSSPDHISDEAMINRSTVYRLLPRIAAKNWIEYKLSPEGRLITQYALTELTRPVTSYITDTPGPSPRCLPEPFTGIDGVSNCDAANRVNQSQKATLSQNATHSTLRTTPQQLTGTKDLTGYASAHVRRGKELARQTARALNDTHSLGQHTQLWYEALTLDEANRNATCENAVLSITRDLQDRFNRTGRQQGAAFTARVKQMLAYAKAERNR
jgi:hypothetical protein